jgi:hypothetical protein
MRRVCDTIPTCAGTVGAEAARDALTSESSDWAKEGHRPAAERSDTRGRTASLS